VAVGVLLVTSAITSGGTDLRPGRYDDLADLARAETQRVQALRARVDDLNAEVELLGQQVSSPALRREQRRIARLQAPAGLTAVEGPGVTVTLQDAPESVRESAGDQVSNTIVHQQDIQAVVNALWLGGAEAMTLQGQRVVSTTGIKCVGNTVLLHGVTYSPPYVVSAIGDVAAMQASIASSRYIGAYLEAVDQDQLGWELDVEHRLTAPAYDGPTDLSFAHSAGRS
jgi:uncharacterized protein YlxW (UPF0749 family)